MSLSDMVSDRAFDLNRGQVLHDYVSAIQKNEELFTFSDKIYRNYCL